MLCRKLQEVNFPELVTWDQLEPPLRQVKVLEVCEQQIWQKELRSRTRPDGRRHRHGPRCGSSLKVNGNESLKVAQKEAFSPFSGQMKFFTLAEEWSLRR